MKLAMVQGIQINAECLGVFIITNHTAVWSHFPVLKLNEVLTVIHGAKP